MKKSFSILLCCIFAYMILAGNLLSKISQQSKYPTDSLDTPIENVYRPNLEIVYNSNAKLLSVNYLDNKKITYINLCSLSGQKLFEQSEKCQSVTHISTNTISEGIYIINLINEDSERLHKKVFITH
jgi:hypothetical protein